MILELLLVRSQRVCSVAKRELVEFAKFAAHFEVSDEVVPSVRGSVRTDGKKHSHLRRTGRTGAIDAGSNDTAPLRTEGKP